MKKKQGYYQFLSISRFQKFNVSGPHLPPAIQTNVIFGHKSVGNENSVLHIRIN